MPNNLSDWNGCKVCGDFRLVIASARDQNAGAAPPDLRMACSNGHGYVAEPGEWLSLDLTNDMIGSPSDWSTTSTTVIERDYGWGVGWGFDSYAYDPYGWSWEVW